MKYALKPLSMIVLAASLTACGGSSSSDKFSYNASPMIENITNEIIVKGYQDLDTKAETLITALNTLQDTQNDTNLLAAQNAWKAARTPWEQGESHIFGPVDTLGIDPHLDSWPLDTTQLATTVNAVNPDFNRLNDNVQGFHAMEYLLFGNGETTNTRSATLTNNERAYLSALSARFRLYTSDLYQAWTEGDEPYKNHLLTPDNKYYSSNVDVLDEIVEGLIGIVDEVGNGKIADPFGASIDKADVTQVESQYSWNSLADFTNNIKGVQNVYRGKLDTTTGSCDLGLCDFIHAADPTLATRIDMEIQTAIEAIQAIGNDGTASGMPFRVAIKDVEGRKRIQVAIDALSTLQNSLEKDVKKDLLGRWKGE